MARNPWTPFCVAVALISACGTRLCAADDPAATQVDQAFIRQAIALAASARSHYSPPFGAPDFSAVFVSSSKPNINVHPNTQKDDIGARLVVPSSLSELTSATGVPKYSIFGSIVRNWLIIIGQISNRGGTADESLSLLILFCPGGSLPMPPEKISPTS
jgi:hypothetical protein